MGSAVPGLIHIDKATRGARDSICPSAWVRFSVRKHGLDSSVGSCGRQFGPSGCYGEGCGGLRPHSQARPRRPRQGRSGFTVSRACRRFAAEVGLTAYALMAAAAVATSPASKVKPYAAGRRPPPISRQRRRPRSPLSGEPVRAGSQDPALPPHRTAFRWPGVRPHATDRQGSGAVLRYWEPVTDV
jgi:hypothetical protein